MAVFDNELEIEKYLNILDTKVRLSMYAHIIACSFFPRTLTNSPNNSLTDF